MTQNVLKFRFYIYFYNFIYLLIKLRISFPKNYHSKLSYVNDHFLQDIEILSWCPVGSVLTNGEKSL